ncbi:MAG: cofactor assembly of complex C subunit B [Prochlorothrix sp.]|nr:cofactor assembly of complex C subunit B [Prochlorothrix sp.]
MAGTVTLPSTFFLTILLAVGLMFFIRASIKERIETLEFTLEQDVTTIATQFQQHFQQRAYKLVSADMSPIPGEGASGAAVPSSEVTGAMEDATTAMAAETPGTEPIASESIAPDPTQTSDGIPGSQTLVFEGFVAPSWFLAIFLTGLAAIGFLCISLVLAISAPKLTVLWFSLPLLSPLAGVFYWKGAKRPERVSLTVATRAGSAHPQVSVTGHRDELTALRQAFRIPRSE